MKNRQINFIKLTSWGTQRCTDKQKDYDSFQGCHSPGTLIFPDFSLTKDHDFP